jgi:hypothetical protein
VAALHLLDHLHGALCGVNGHKHGEAPPKYAASQAEEELGARTSL